MLQAPKNLPHQSWISPPTAFRHWMFLGLFFCPDWIIHVFGLSCMSHYLHHAEILNQLLPAPRKLFHLSGCTKHGGDFHQSPAPPMESCGSLRVPPEALSMGTCWEQHASAFIRTRIALPGRFPGGCVLALPQMCPNTLLVWRRVLLPSYLWWW